MTVSVQPIRSPADYEQTLREIETLMGAQPGSREEDRLEVLAALVAAYEAKQGPRPSADPISVLQLALRAQGKGQKDVAATLGSRSRASEILSRKRHLSADMIEKLSRAFAIPAHLLAAPYEVATGRLRRVLVSGAAATAVVLGLAGAGTGLLFWRYGQDLPDAATLASYQPPSLVRRDDAGRLLQQRSFVPLSEIPPHVVKAFLAAEDQDFYDHGGVSTRAILRASLQNIASLGINPAGGSTISQQVAKNVLLTGQPRSLERKVKEVILARRIEANLTKDQILEIYLNQIYFGGSAYGIAAASQAYFGKEPADLTLAEAAYLAALPKAPNHYRLDMAENRSRAKDRRDWVLARMADDGLITPTAAHLAAGEPLTVSN
ncbi:transglycosylase domain-containing protein [Microvirga sp. CF3016]|uniref:transglycosylase domain-containing protein n=1 Tax=Microvirga sp. CF3016 TaxID=3110181 RepID=UPI002E791583|nr:transglycosylase domain-containing protein [Microvirga sp. CF3016]MEE1610283.1 transglycosylase domain-containing protein [Microvirga sp. CF3016]